MLEAMPQRAPNSEPAPDFELNIPPTPAQMRQTIDSMDKIVTDNKNQYPPAVIELAKKRVAELRVELEKLENSANEPKYEAADMTESDKGGLYNRIDNQEAA